MNSSESKNLLRYLLSEEVAESLFWLFVRMTFVDDCVKVRHFGHEDAGRKIYNEILYSSMREVFDLKKGDRFGLTDFGKERIFSAANSEKL